MPDGPLIVVIDDVAGDREGLADLFVASGARAVPLHPQEVNDASVFVEAGLVVIDEYLKAWPEREALYRTAAEPTPAQLPLTMRPQLGVSVAAVLRERIAEAHRPTPIVVRTGEIERLTGNLPAGQREHLFARQHDIEWLFDKTAEHVRTPDVPDAVTRMLALAAATDDIPRGTTDVAAIGSWMNLDDVAWADLARYQIALSRPPRAALSDASDGRELLRWLLHQLLPYPAALLDRWLVAARLGIEADAVLGLPDDGFFAPLAQARYTGPLAGFVGPRWWRAGVDRFVEEGLPMAAARDRGAAVAAHHTAEPVDFDTAVPVRNVELSPDGLADSAEAVRILPDDWPPFADAAYARAADAASGALAHLRHSADAERWRPRR
jgi:CheY-like chemotaxis protein